MKMLKALCVGLAICGSVWVGTAWAGSGMMGGTDTSNFIVTSDYIIGPQDVLEISVWRNPDLSRQVTVRPDGRISLPLIGDVDAVIVADQVEEGRVRAGCLHVREPSALRARS